MRALLRCKKACALVGRRAQFSRLSRSSIARLKGDRSPRPHPRPSSIWQTRADCNLFNVLKIQDTSSIAIIPVQFDLRAVVDLQDAAVHQLLETDPVELSINFRSVPVGAPPAATQVLGERVAASLRIAGLLYESPARPGHFDLAVIEAALRPLGSWLVVNDPNNKLSDALP